MGERQEEREKKRGELEERTEERTEGGTEETEECLRKLLRKVAKKMRGVRKIQSPTRQPRQPGSVLHSLTAKKLQLWSL